MAACESATGARAYFDFRDMAGSNKTGGYPYTPALQLMHGLAESTRLLLEEGLENAFARHHRLAEAVRKAVAAWGMTLCANAPSLYSDTVTAIYVPDGFDANELINHAYDTYGVSYGVGLGELSGKAFRIGHLGSLPDAMALSGLAIIEMAMNDLGYPITLGSGVAAAQQYLCAHPASTASAAA